MDKKELKKRFEEEEIYFTIRDLNRLVHLYQRLLIEEIYAVRTAMFFLTWLESEGNYPLGLSSEEIIEASKTLKKMTSFRHRRETFEDRDYNALINKTDDDFFGGLFLRDLVYTLDCFAPLVSDDQDPPEQSPHPLEVDETKRKKRRKQGTCGRLRRCPSNRGND